MQDPKISRIIQEVGEEFGLTKEKSLTLYDQYWNEFVLRSLYEINYCSIKVLELGSLTFKKRRAEVSLEREAKGEYDMSDKLKDKYHNLIRMMENRNSKFKIKRIYG